MGAASRTTAAATISGASGGSLLPHVIPGPIVSTRNRQSRCPPYRNLECGGEGGIRAERGERERAARSLKTTRPAND